MLSLFGLSFIYFLRRVKVVNILCTSQFGDCPAEIDDFLEDFKGQSYFDSKRALSSAFSQNPRIAYYRIRFNLPDVMAVEITERNPELAAKFGENNFFIFDKEGVSLGQVKESSLSTVTVYELPREKLFRFAIVLAREIFKYYGATNVAVDKHGLYAQVKNVEVVFPLEGDIDVLLGSLEVSLLQLNERSKNSTIILAAGKNYKVDLRYKNPVVSQI